MALPSLAGAERITFKTQPAIGKAGLAEKPAGQLVDTLPNFFSTGKNKENLSGANGKNGVVQGFKDLVSGMPSNKKDALLDLLKGGLGLDDQAFNAFSTLFKGGKFSEIPADQLLAAGQFIYNMIS